MYKCLLDIRVWGVNNNDPAMAWNRRRWAQKAAQTISKTNQALVTAVAAEKQGRGLFEFLASFVSPAYRVRKIALEKGSLRSAGHAIVEGLLAAGKTIEETADICWLTSFGGIGVPVTAVRIHTPFSRPACSPPSSSPRLFNTSFALVTRSCGKPCKAWLWLTTPNPTRSFASTCLRRSV
jgi:hypothetical protein